MARNGFSPLRDFMSLRDGMDRLFEDRWVSPGSWLTWSSSGTSFLPLDIYETADDIVVRAVHPGRHARRDRDPVPERGADAPRKERGASPARWCALERARN